MTRMLSTLLLVSASGSCAFAQATPTATVFDFEGATVGPAALCSPGLTGGGKPVDWQIVDDPSSPSGPKVIAEVSGDRTGNRFPLCIFPDFEAKNVEITTRFKPVSGTVDQAAGLIVRARDENNYYVVRANALEGNVGFYKVENGVRRQLAGANAAVANGQWQTLGLRIRGDKAEILFNDQVLFSHQDATFAEAGRVGLWTKADSLTHFDQVKIMALPD